MIVAEIQHLVDEYLTWLKDKTILRGVGEWVEITTPYLDRHNDYIQIYAKRQNGHFVLTDDSFTIDDLRLSGCELNTPKRDRLLRMTLNGFGIQLDGDALTTRATERDFGVRKHNLVQAMLAVNDLFYLAPASVRSLFVEDIEAWLDLAEIRFVPNAKFTGTSGFDHVFNFVVPRSRVAPERIIQAINRPSRDSAQKVLLAWLDTREVRAPDSRAYAFLNDESSETPRDVIDALESYNVRVVPWSHRESVREELAA
jgi:hypothetical protein